MSSCRPVFFVVVGNETRRLGVGGACGCGHAPRWSCMGNAKALVLVWNREIEWDGNGPARTSLPFLKFRGILLSYCNLTIPQPKTALSLALIFVCRHSLGTPCNARVDMDDHFTMLTDNRRETENIVPTETAALTQGGQECFQHWTVSATICNGTHNLPVHWTFRLHSLWGSWISSIMRHDHERRRSLHLRTNANECQIVNWIWGGVCHCSQHCEWGAGK